MKNILRQLLFINALIIGGWLGILLLNNNEPLKRLGFFAICGVLGLVFNYIDRNFPKQE